MDEIESALAQKGILDSLRPIDNEQEQRIMQKFRLDWNYHSNHIEGNSLSYGETKALILFNITAQGKPLKDHFEIKGHNEAIDWVIDVIKNKEDLTEHFIRQLHEVLLKEPYMSDAMTPDGKPTKNRIEVGKYKTLPNHVRTVTGEIFHFASPEETPAKMHDLLKWYHEKKQREETNAILMAAEFHYRFVRIHPFDDGNGRMARMLMNFILMQYGYPPVIIRTEDKLNYIRMLELADSDTIAPFIEYIASNLNRSLDIMIAGAQGESIEEPNDIDKEMLLLEQQINNTSKKIEVYRSEEVVRLLIVTSLHEILNKFTVQMNKLASYYKKSEPYLVVDGKASPYFDTHSLAQSIDANVGNYNRHFSHYRESLDFQEVSFGNLFTQLISPRKNVMVDNSSSIITVKLFAVYYQLSNSLGDKISKHYDEELTDDEIDTVIKKEVLHHMKFIAQKIKEAEELNSDSN